MNTEKKKPIHKRVASTTKKVLVWCLVKPIIKVSFISSEEKMFLKHAKRFLKDDVFKDEYVNKK